MQIEPAHVNQVRQGDDGRVYEISADASTVAADLQKLDAGLKVRFAEKGKCWVVYHEHHDGCPHNGTGGPGSTYLVKAIDAEQSALGVWTGLDNRLVERMREIDPEGRGHYDYAAALEAHNRKVHAERKHKIREEMGEMGEQAAFFLRKDLGANYRGRVFVPRGVRSC